MSETLETPVSSETQTQTETHGFQAAINQLLKLMMLGGVLSVILALPF